MTMQIDLNRIGFFKPVVGKTLREQLQDKKLAGADVVDFVRSIGGDEVTPPAHWERRPFHEYAKPFYGFSLIYVDSTGEGGQRINGFVWSGLGTDFHYRRFDGDPLDLVVGKGWAPTDWILIEL